MGLSPQPASRLEPPAGPIAYLEFYLRAGSGGIPVIDHLWHRQASCRPWPFNFRTGPRLLCILPGEPKMVDHRDEGRARSPLGL
jgi:hypothetical protein